MSALCLTNPAGAATFLPSVQNWKPDDGNGNRGGKPAVDVPTASRLLRDQAEIGVLDGLSADEGPLAAALVAIKRAIDGDLVGAEAALAASGDGELSGGEKRIARALILRGEGKFAEAASVIDMLLAQDPDNAYAQNLRGTIAYRLEGAKAALPYFTAAADAGPEGATYWSNLAAVLIDGGRRETGRRALSHAVALSPETCSTLLALAALELEDGDPRAAAERYTACLETEPDRSDAATGLVSALVQAGDLVNARQTLELYREQVENAALFSVEIALREGALAQAQKDISLVQDQDSPQVQAALGRLKLALGLWSEARSAFEAALDLAPQDPVASAGLRAMALAGGTAAAPAVAGEEVADAEAIFRALELISNGSPDPAETRAAFVAGQGAIKRFRVDGLTQDDLVRDLPAEAARELAVPVFLEMTSTRGRNAVMLTALSEKYPTSALIKFFLADAIVSENGDVAVALNALEAALARSGQFLAAHLMRADLALRSGDLATALNAYRIASEISPEPQTLLRAGLLAEQLGDLDAAEASLRDFVDRAPDSYVALNQLGWFLVSRRGGGDALDEGERLASKALELKPGNAAILDTLGWIAYKRGDLDAALEKLDEAVAAAQGKSPEIVLHLVEVSLKAGQDDKARAALRPLYSDKDNSPLESQISALAKEAGLDLTD
ncbi:tetratricopeptide repeat protein [Roseibium aggregatum]|uniref:Tetratricopeptide repeat protein n=1 Tax=Roseibium aggregatum TaxID=187304 RepID=A0A939ECI1_9HYPH|nr:tetratricopeptide repeat protein [Roseibium aggregatum]MBN9669563.1 tetratricopeptide repeat protein [Roseibium aggregatum]